VADLKLHNIPGTGPLIRADQGAGTRATADLINFQKNNSEVFSVDYQGLPDPGGSQATRQVVIPIGDIVADSDALESFLIEFRKAVTITDADFWVDTATADGSTNKQTLTIKRSSDNATVVAFTTAAENPGVAQATVTDMGEVGNAAIGAGEYLYMTYTKTSSGLAMSGNHPISWKDQ